MKAGFAVVLLALMAAMPAFSAASDEEPKLTMEQQLFNDFALRMQEQLQRSATLLERIRQSVDSKEREMLMNEYQELTQKTMKIHHLMQQLAGGSEMSKKAAMMKCKMMDAKGKGCGMMKKSGAKQAVSATEAPDPSEADGVAGEGEPPQGEEGNASPVPKEKHH